MVNELLSYIYDQSDGRTAIRQAIDDYYVTGMGFIQVYQNPQADGGKGEVMIKDIDPIDVYIDPNSRDRYFDDAENIIVSRLFSKAQLEKMYPQYKNAIQAASGEYETDQIVTGGKDNTGITFPGEVDTFEEDTYIRGYERYSKITENMYRVFQQYDQKEYRLSQKEFEQYIASKVGMYQGKIIEGEDEAQKLNIQISQMKAEKMETIQKAINEDIDKMKEELLVQYAELEHQLTEQVQLGEMLPERMQLMLRAKMEEIEKQTDDAFTKAMEEAQLTSSIPGIKMTDKAELIEKGLIEVVPVGITKIKMCVTVGDKYIYSRVLPTSN